MTEFQKKVAKKSKFASEFPFERVEVSNMKKKRKIIISENTLT